MAVEIGDWTRFGAAIRDERKRQGLTQERLAQEAGVSRSWLARVEKGHRGAELEQIFRLLGHLRLTMTLAGEDAEGDRPAAIPADRHRAGVSGVEMQRRTAAALSRSTAWLGGNAGWEDLRKQSAGLSASEVDDLRKNLGSSLAAPTTVDRG